MELLCGLFNSLRHVDDITKNRELEASFITDNAAIDDAAMDADPDSDGGINLPLCVPAPD